MEKGLPPENNIHAPLTPQGTSSEPQNAAVEEVPPPKKAEYNFITPGMRWNWHTCLRAYENVLEVKHVGWLPKGCGYEE